MTTQRLCILNAFIKACENGNLELIKHMIYNSVNKRDHFIISPDYGFSAAITNKQYKIIDYLLKCHQESKIIIYILNHFYDACKNGNIEFIKYLIDNSLINNFNPTINMYNTSFKRACDYQQIKILDYLFECHNTHKIKMSDWCCINYACITGNLQLLDKYKLIKSFDCFELACKYKQFKVIKYLMKYCKRIIDDKPQISFNSACNTGNIEIVKCIIDCDFDNSIIVDNGLKYACENKHQNVINYLSDCYKTGKIKFINDSIINLFDESTYQTINKHKQHK